MQNTVILQVRDGGKVHAEHTYACGELRGTVVREELGERFAGMGMGCNDGWAYYSLDGGATWKAIAYTYPDELCKALA